jgi:hypothetical protein
MKDLAASVNVEGGRIVVYNSLPWNRSGLVTIQTNQRLNGSLKNLANNKIIEFTRNNNIIQFFADDVPALGYTTYVPTNQIAEDNSGKINIDEKNGIIENEFFKIKLDKITGSVTSLFDKKGNKEAVKQNSEWNFGQYVYERFSKKQTDKYAEDYIKAGWHWAYAELGRINLDESPYKKTSGIKPRISYHEDDISVSAVIYFDPSETLIHKYAVLFTLYKNQPFVEVIWSINGKPADAWPEAGWMSFPFNVENPEFKLGRTGGIVNPAKDYIRGSNLDYCFLNTGMAVVDSNNQGFGIMSPDVPAVSLDRPGLWKYSRDFTPEKANVFFNLYNNQWSTNFTEWVEGSWNTRFYIWSINDYSNEKSIITPSEEFRNPLLADFNTRKPGELATSNTGIKISEKGILVTAYKNETGGDLLRLWEQAGKDSNCKIELPQAKKYNWVQSVNLRGEPNGEKVAIKNNEFEIELGAYQPASYLLIE